MRRGGRLGDIRGKSIAGRGNIPGPTVATRLVYLREDQGSECGSVGGNWRALCLETTVGMLALSFGGGKLKWTQ